MKYGIIVTTPLNDTKEKFINIGDEFQALAILRIYQKMGIKDADIIYIDYNDIKNYKGEYVLLPICINLQLDYDILPLPSNIIPCFIGLSFFAQGQIPFNVEEYLKKYQPIGCRDEQTLSLLRKYNIDAYLAGCITATLDRRDSSCHGDTIYCIDLSDEIFEKIPKSVFENYRVKRYSHIFVGDRYMDCRYNMLIGKKLLEEYKEQGRLIITSRLHALSPCMAMGLPVIGLFTNISPRMAWIDKFIKLHTIEDINDIDWNGNVINYESIKSKMINNIIHRIEETYQRYNDLLDISWFLENRERALYGSYYYKKAKELPKCHFKYIIWGGGQIAIQLVEVLKNCCPQAELIGVIDSYIAGKVFDGIIIEKPEVVEKKYMDVLCINATYSGKAFVKKFMADIGKTNWVDFSSVNG